MMSGQNGIKIHIFKSKTGIFNIYKVLIAVQTVTYIRKERKARRA